MDFCVFLYVDRYDADERFNRFGFQFRSNCVGVQILYCGRNREILLIFFKPAKITGKTINRHGKSFI